MKTKILNEDILSEILEHHGIKGQKHGVRRGPPYPLDRKSKAERKAEKEAKKKQRKKLAQLKKARKTRKKNLEAKKKEEAKNAKKESKIRKKKESVFKRGSPEKLYRNRNLISTKDEIQDVLDRFNWEQQIQQYSANRLENTAKKAASLVKIMGSVVGGYNTIAGAYNAWFPDETPLPHINTGKPDSQKKPENQNKRGT